MIINYNNIFLVLILVILMCLYFYIREYKVIYIFNLYISNFNLNFIYRFTLCILAISNSGGILSGLY